MTGIERDWLEYTKPPEAVILSLEPRVGGLSLDNSGCIVGTPRKCKFWRCLRVTGRR